MDVKSVFSRAETLHQPRYPDTQSYQSVLLSSLLLRYLSPIRGLGLIEKEPAHHLSRPIALELADRLLQGGAAGDQEGKQGQEGEPSEQHCEV